MQEQEEQLPSAVPVSAPDMDLDSAGGSVAGDGSGSARRDDPTRVTAVTEALSEVKDRMEATGWKHWTAPTVRKAVEEEAQQAEQRIRKGDEQVVAGGGVGEEMQAQETQSPLPGTDGDLTPGQSAASSASESAAGFAGVVERLRREQLGQ